MVYWVNNGTTRPFILTKENLHLCHCEVNKCTDS